MPITALALVIPRPREIELAEISLPEPGDADLLVRTEFSAISVGTERWALDEYRPEARYPMVPGYLGYGVVEWVGPAVQGWAEGDRLHFCASRLPEPYSLNWMGSHVSRAVVTVREDPGYPFLVKLPEDFDGPAGALLGLGAVSMRGTRMMRVDPGANALVTGQGMIGQMAAQCLRARGARVMTSDVMPLRVERSAQWSADRAVNAAQEDLAAVGAEFAPGGFDLIVDTSGSNALLQDLWPLLKTFGQFLLQGWYPGDVTVDFHSVHGHRPTVYITSGHGREDAEPVLDLAQRGIVHIAPLVSHVIAPGEAAGRYLDLVEHGREEFLGVVFDWRGA